MPLTAIGSEHIITSSAIGWTQEEDEKLADLVQEQPQLWNVYHPSRTSILANETTWVKIANALGKRIEDCKKHWRSLHDGYMRSKRVGVLDKIKEGIFYKLQFLDSIPMEPVEQLKVERVLADHALIPEVSVSEVETEQVITDNQEYFEVTVEANPLETEEPNPLETTEQKPQEATKRETTDNNTGEPPKKIKKKNPVGRKKANIVAKNVTLLPKNAIPKNAIPLPKNLVIPKNLTPVKILPKPILMNGKLVNVIEQKKPGGEQRNTIDKLVEKVLKEHTNEIDVFFRSMAASVKKMQPNLIPKVKMEVCNVIAKYEMQTFERNC